MQNRGGVGIFGYIFPLAKGGVTIRFPDFPDIEVRGKDMQEAERKGYDALGQKLEDLMIAGGKLPVFKSNIQVAKERKAYVKNGSPFSAIAFVFSKPVNAEPIRFNIIANVGEIGQIDKAAKATGKSRSRFLIEAGLEKANKVSKTRT